MTKVKLIIAGGRDYHDYHALKGAFLEFMNKYDNTDVSIISGMAKGADAIGVRLAREYGLDLIEKPAFWNRQPDGSFDRAAGHKRNAEMAKIGTHLLAAWNGTSKGTAGMIKLAERHNLITKVVNY